jgi:hypothetical protein
MKTLKFLVFAMLALSMATACTKEDVNTSSIHGKWKVIEENNPWDPDIIQPVDYYRVWEFFPDGTFKYYQTMDNIDDHFSTYELKSDSLYIYHDNMKEEFYTHIYRCRFIDAKKNKIEIEYLRGLTTLSMKPSLWIYERVNK